MEAREIEIRFNKKTGDIKFETHNFKGDSCEKFIDNLVTHLGLDKGSVEEKPEKTQEVVNADVEYQRLTGN